MTNRLVVATVRATFDYEAEDAVELTLAAGGMARQNASYTPRAHQCASQISSRTSRSMMVAGGKAKTREASEAGFPYNFVEEVAATPLEGLPRRAFLHAATVRVSLISVFDLSCRPDCVLRVGSKATVQVQV